MTGLSSGRSLTLMECGRTSSSDRESGDSSWALPSKFYKSAIFLSFPMFDDSYTLRLTRMCQKANIS